MRLADQHGFSLIEVLVAMTIMALAGVALSSAVLSAGRSAIDARERAMAALAAENVMNTVLLSSDRAAGGMRSQSGRYEVAGALYDWTLDVRPTSDPALLQLALIVRDDEGPIVERVTYRRVR